MPYVGRYRLPREKSKCTERKMKILFSTWWMVHWHEFQLILGTSWMSPQSLSVVASHTSESPLFSLKFYFWFPAPICMNICGITPMPCVFPCALFIKDQPILHPTSSEFLKTHLPYPLPTVFSRCLWASDGSLDMLLWVTLCLFSKYMQTA